MYWRTLRALKAQGAIDASKQKARRKKTQETLMTHLKTNTFRAELIAATRLAVFAA